MVKFLKFLILILTASYLFYMDCAFSIDVIPEGKLIRKSSSISRQSTVQMYFNADHPPVINVTPGTLTLVQFPTEVRSCTSGTTLITITYGDKTGSSSPSSAASSASASSSSSSSSSNSNASQGGDAWYSALFLNADGPSISKMDPSDLLNTPPTDMICQIKVSSTDSQQPESYAWKVIGIKMARPEDTYHVVYLLDEKNLLNTEGLPSEKELMESGEPYIDVNKLGRLSKSHNKLNKRADSNQRTILTENINSNLDGSHILEIYDFSKSKNRPPSPKM